jgi:hypothetical protein
MSAIDEDQDGQLRSEASVGWCEPAIEDELPGLRIALREACLPERATPSGPAPAAVRERLASLSNRFNGSKAINLRREPVPAAYRVFFRHIGLDPDVVRTPIEEAVLERMFDGAFLTRNLLADVLLIALLDTGVPVWALDADTLHGTPGIRMSRAGELGEQDEGGQLMIAAGDAAIGALFAAPKAPHCPSNGSRRLLLYALQVDGVPWLTIEETLWICRSALEAVT